MTDINKPLGVWNNVRSTIRSLTVNQMIRQVQPSIRKQVSFHLYGFIGNPIWDDVWRPLANRLHVLIRSQND